MDNWDKVWEEGWRVGGGEEGLVIKKFCSDEGNYSDKTTCTDEKVLYQEAMSLVWMFVADRRLVTQAILFLVFEANLHSNIIHNCRYASESTGMNITCSGTYAVLILDGCLFLYSLLQC
jgi:hypothetical protein